MRTFLFPFACTLLFAGIGRAEFDAGPAKPNATQSAFDGMASRRPAQKPDLLIVDFVEIGNLVIWPAQFPVRFVPFGAPGGRVRVIHRPANVPSQPYIVNPTGYYWDGATMTK
jgi:hypothetical protein